MKDIVIIIYHNTIDLNLDGLEQYKKCLCRSLKEKKIRNKKY